MLDHQGAENRRAGNAPCARLALYPGQRAWPARIPDHRRHVGCLFSLYDRGKYWYQFFPGTKYLIVVAVLYSWC